MDLRHYEESLDSQFLPISPHSVLTSQVTTGLMFFIALNVISLLEKLPSFETHSTFGSFPHFFNILPDVLQRTEGS